MKSITRTRPLKKRITSIVDYFTLNKMVKKFLKPLKLEITDREAYFYKSAKTLTVYVPTIQKEILVYEYGYSKKKDLLVHGWSGRASQFYMLADKLLENRRMIITFDAPAHGKSKGFKSSKEEFIKIISFLHLKYNFEMAIGHSIGAMTLLESVAKGIRFNKIVCIAATNDIDEIIMKFLINHKVNPNLVEEFKVRFKKRYGYDLASYNGVEYAKKIRIPTLIIHDSQDKPSDVSSAYIIRQNLKLGELLVTYNLGHTRILKDSTVNNRIIDFINDEK